MSVQVSSEELAELLAGSNPSPSLKRCYDAAHGSEPDIGNTPPTIREPLLPTTATHADNDEGDILDSLGDTEIARKLKDLLRHNIHQDLDTLYTVLSRQLRGCDSRHVLRLRLDGFCYKDHDYQKTRFQFYINSNHTGHPYTWVHCTMDRQWHNPPETSEATLCQHLARAEEKRKSLLISINPKVQTQSGKSDKNMVNGELGWTDNNKGSQWTLRYDPPSVRTKRMASLNELIDCARKDRWLNLPPFIERYRLCFNLALSAFFLAGGSWLGARWCQGRYFENNIYFWPDQDSGRQRNRTEAYLSCELDLQAPLSKEAATSRRSQNLLELGKILFEAGLWETPRFLERSEPHLSEKTMREKLEALVDERAESRAIESNFIKAVKACLWPGSSAAAQDAGSAAALSDENAFRYYILSEILLPLARCAETNDLTAEEPEYRPLSATGQGQQEPLKKLPHRPEAGPHSERSQFFMDDLDAFNDQYIYTLDKFRPVRDERFRIAVIDSGVCERDWEIGQCLADGRIKDRRGFCGTDTDECEDFLGHGTTVTKILLRASPRAEVFIAKVTNSKIIEKEEIPNMCEAIDFAVRIWDADVINLSIGLSEPSPDFDEVITKAMRSGKIVVAAAHGNKHERSFPIWPGRKDGVIAIHSIDDYSDARRTGNQDDKVGEYFAIPGRDIRIEELFIDDSITPKFVYATGVSYATPVAAGIAASVLEILRYQGTVASKDFKSRFCNGGFIRKVFLELAKESGTLNPWPFWQRITHNAREFNDIHLRPHDADNMIKVLDSYVV